MIKKYLSAASVGLLLIALSAVAVKNEDFKPVIVEEISTEVPLTPSEAYDVALKKGADLQFWYNDKSYDGCGIVSS